MIKINPYDILSINPIDGAPCLSLYANSERQLATLLTKAEELALKSYDAKTVDRLLKPIHQFTKNNMMQSKSLPTALFVSAGFSGYARLPLSAKPLVVVAESFHVKPLLKWMQREHPFSLLCLREQEATLHLGSLSYFEQIEYLPYRQLRKMGGTLNSLDRVVYQAIQSSKVPLILAGDFELIEVYKNVTSYKALIDETIIDPSVYDDSQKLHQAAVEILEPFLEQKELTLLNSYWAADRRGRTTSNLKDLVQLALLKKIKHLFVNEKMHVWGKINHTTARFSYSSQQTETGDDILDDLAEIVLKNHGAATVLPAEKMPNGYAACAILSSMASANIFGFAKQANELDSSAN